MTVTSRESVLGLATFAVALFGVSALLARPKLQRWKDLAAEQGQVRLEIERDRAMISEKSRWDGEFQKLSGMLPVHAADMKMDVHWLAFMDQVAAENGVRITKRRAGEESQEGDVFELPIEVEHEGWEAPLDALVHFLFALQSEGAMLDIRQLRIKPSPNGQLVGRFTLYCAYRRGKVAAPQRPPGDGGRK
jgi:hypothetical protein